jgi:hypothetical protein
MMKRFGTLRVHQNGVIEGPSLRELQVKLDGKLQRYIVADKQRFLVHELVARCFCERSADHTHVIHRDYDLSNNNWTNLKWVTLDEYAHHWGRKSGPPRAKSVGRTNFPDGFYQTIHQNRKYGLSHVKKVLQRTEWHDHGLSDIYLKDIMRGRVRRDLYLKYRDKSLKRTLL